MKSFADEKTSTLEHLADQVRDLELRVRALEACASTPPPETGRVASEQPVPQPNPAPQLESKLPADLIPALSAGLIPMLGKAVLGVAGAYLLRAAAESGRFPGPVAVAASVIYAAVWLATSVTTPRGSGPARAFYAATAALIFFPMLWETTVTFRILSAPAAAGLLIAFVLLGSGLDWFRDAAPVMWVTALPAAGTAMLLMVATGATASFAFALLAICVMVESAAIIGEPASGPVFAGASRLDRWLRIRPWVALTADTGIWLVILVAASPVPLGAYQSVGRLEAVGLCLALLGIYAVSTGIRVIGLRRRAGVVETSQLVVAFSLGVGGALWLTHGAAALGVFCLISACFYYRAALTRFDPVALRRNQRIYTTFGLGLVLAASVLLLSRSAATVLCSGLAVAATFASARVARPLLAVHGVICLAASAYLAGLLGYAQSAITADVSPAPPSALLWTVAAAALLSYLVSSREPEGKWTRLVTAGFTAAAAVAFLVTIAAHFCGGVRSSSWLPTIRTLVLCSVALLSAMNGGRFPTKLGRKTAGPELALEAGAQGAARPKPLESAWIGYAAMAAATVKLFVEDFRRSPPAALAISLLCYGAVLIFGPRLTRLRTVADR